MVDDDVLPLASPGSVGTIVHILYLRATATYESHYHIVALTEVEGVVAQGDAIARCCLSGDGGVRGDVKLRLKVDISAHVEDDGFGSTLRESPSQRASSAVVEVGDMIDLSTSSSCSISSEALCSGEGRSLCLGSDGRDHHRP